MVNSLKAEVIAYSYLSLQCPGKFLHQNRHLKNINELNSTEPHLDVLFMVCHPVWVYNRTLVTILLENPMKFHWGSSFPLKNLAKEGAADWYSSIHSFIPQFFVEYLLCATHSSWGLECISKQTKIPALVEFTFKWEAETENKYNK